MYVANVAEDDLEGKSPLVSKVREYAEKVGASVVSVCAKIESEIAELDADDRDNNSTTQQLNNSTTQQLNNSTTQQLNNSTSTTILAPLSP